MLPPRLLRNRVFAVTSAVGFVVGFALFGAVTYLPLFLQVVKGASPDRLGAAAGAADGRPADHLDRLRAGDHAHRPLQGVPDRRHRGDDAGPVPALDDGLDEQPGADLRVHVRARPGAGDGDAGARAGRAERRRVLRPGRGHLGRDAVPLDRRLARHGDARGDLLQPPARGAQERAARRARRRKRAPAARSTRRRSRTCHRRCTRATCTRSPAR